MFSNVYLLTNKFTKKNEVIYFMKINSTYIPFLLELNPGSQLEKTKWEKEKWKNKQKLGKSYYYISLRVLYQVCGICRVKYLYWVPEKRIKTYWMSSRLLCSPLWWMLSCIRNSRMGVGLKQKIKLWLMRISKLQKK